MSANERLHKVQAALEQRGVRDVKFCFAPGAGERMGLTAFQNNVATFFETYLAGKFTVLPRVRDPISK